MKKLTIHQNKKKVYNLTRKNKQKLKTTLKLENIITFN